MVILFVLMSLLFSVGEGLRLTPFAAKLDSAEQQQLNISSDDGSIAVQSGPIVGPKQFRKRNKLHSPEFEIPQAVGFTVATQFEKASIVDRPLAPGKISNHSTSGRAPPA